MNKRRFPQPEYIGTRRFWRLSALLRFEGRETDAVALTPADDLLLNSAQVCQRYGQISTMTLHRWCQASETVAA